MNYRWMYYLLSGLVVIALTGCDTQADKKRADQDATITKQLLEKSRNEMIFVKGGTYTMGASNPKWQSYPAYPPHKVKLTSFYFSKYNIDYGQYDTYVKITNQHRLNNIASGTNVHNSKIYPVSNATWYQANDYCKWLAKKSELPYSLPTEAQWEYVARDRGKKNWPFPTNNGKQVLGINFPSFSMHADKFGGTFINDFPIGSIPCTPMGVCGLAGETNDWMKDWYDPQYYHHSPINNPQGPKAGKLKAVRGGPGPAMYDSNFNRYGNKPTENFNGFRCVINAATLPAQTGTYVKLVNNNMES